MVAAPEKLDDLPADHKAGPAGHQHRFSQSHAPDPPADVADPEQKRARWVQLAYPTRRRPVKVKDVMTAQVATATPQTSVKDIARTMSRIDSGAVPIVDDGKVVGLVTDRDIVIRVVAEGGDLSGPASAIMTGDVQVCSEDDSIADAAAKMGSHQIRRLAVTDASGGLVGILSLGDVAVEYGAKVVGKTLEEISES